MCARIRLAFFCLIVCFAAACGSNSSGFDEGPQVEIVSPENDLSFQAGSRIMLELSTQHFEFGPPLDAHGHSARTVSALAHANGDPNAGHAEGEHMEEMTVGPQAAPGSRDGHYHIYLDAGRDTDPHVTAWDYQIEYNLPDDISVGTHTLRVELRDNEHQPVGAESILFFRVE